MPRTRSPNSISALVDAAAEAFIANGYARTQIDDVARKLGVAKGTVYGYVTSKEALFALAVAFGDRREELPGLDELPLGVSDLPEPAAVVKQRLSDELDDMLLRDAVQVPRRRTDTEIEEIVSDILKRMHRHQVAIKLVDRCAPEFPALARIWFDEGRWDQVEALTDYLQSQSKIGRLDLPGDPAVIARSIIELCALWAVHMRWDPAPRPVEDEIMLATIPSMVRSMVGPVATSSSHSGSTPDTADE